MTKDMIAETVALKALLSDTADHQILAEMLGFVVDRLTALDVDQRCGAGTHERSIERVNHRNGYRERPSHRCKQRLSGSGMGNSGRNMLSALSECPAAVASLRRRLIS
jgi:hypothetical protein